MAGAQCAMGINPCLYTVFIRILAPRLNKHQIHIMKVRTICRLGNLEVALNTQETGSR